MRFPQRRLTVNLAPPEMRKEGSCLDLPIAVAILLAHQGLKPPPRSAFLGELALDGTVRHVDGVLVAARWLRRRGYEQIFVPHADAGEAGFVDGIDVIPCLDLAGVMRHLTGVEPIPAVLTRPPDVEPLRSTEHDLAEVHGQEEARRALEIAAAGGHHVLMSGPPGAGKTMLARCLPGILPPLELGEALEVAQVRSLLGELPPGRPVDWVRPFRAPHHGISMAGLIGGGSGLANPGEISRAHHGVLFLDELAEFQSTVLQALRQPLEAGRVTITRSGGSVAYPARFTLVAATNPCPCGWAGDARRVCRCTPAAIDTYQRKLRPAARSHRSEGERASCAAGAARERTGGRGVGARARAGHRGAPAPARATGLFERDAQAGPAAGHGFTGAGPSPDARAVGGPARIVGPGVSSSVAGCAHRRRPRRRGAH